MVNKPKRRSRSWTDSRLPEVAMIILRIFVQVSEILRDWLGGQGGPTIR